MRYFINRHFLTFTIEIYPYFDTKSFNICPYIKTIILYVIGYQYNEKCLKGFSKICINMLSPVNM
jgi:hypothetical protein